MQNLLTEEEYQSSLESPLVGSVRERRTVDDSWMERLWAWVDENMILSDVLPRNETELLALDLLDLEDDGGYGYIFNSIPKEIGMLRNLTSLSFTIENDEVYIVPEDIGMLNNLTYLSVDTYNNELHLPKSITELGKLESVSLSGNLSVSTIVQLLQNCKHLQWLQIDNNRILHSLPENIFDCSSLKELKLINNKNLLLSQVQFELALSLRDAEEGYERVYCWEDEDGEGNADVRAGEGVHACDEARAGEEGAENGEEERQRQEKDVPHPHHVPPLLNQDGVQIGGAHQPGQERGVFNRIPGPIAAPAELFVRPEAAE